MHEMNIKSLDLNLLVALKALLDEKHVTRAADRIGLSQPAMSRALSRLRKMFNDPLLVKTSTGFCLTPRAIDLHPPLRAILFEVHQLVLEPSFDPSTIKREIVIATRDYETSVILPKIVNILSKQAPGLTLCSIPLVGDDLSPLEHQEVDFILAGSESQASTLSRYVLFKDKFTCLVSKNNSVNQTSLTLQKYLSLNHCLITIKNSGHGLVDIALSEKKLSRNITVKTPHFLTAAPIIAQSDLIITLPYRLGLYLSKQDQLTMLNPPLKLPSFPIYLYWHISKQNSPLHKWFRKMIRDNCEISDQE